MNYTNTSDFFNVFPQGGMNMYNGMNMNQIYMMTIIPLLTTAFSALTSTVVSDIKNGVGLFFKNFLKFCMKIINYAKSQENEPNIIYIDLHDCSVSQGNLIKKTIKTYAKPLVWYLNKNNFLKIAVFEEQNILANNAKSGAEQMQFQIINSQAEKKTLPKEKNINFYLPFVKQHLKLDKNAENDPKTNDPPVFLKEYPDDGIEIYKKIHFNFIEVRENDAYNGKTPHTYLILSSYHPTLSYIDDFLTKIKNEYDEYCKSIYSPKLYVYVKSKQEIFKILEIDKTLVFEHIFFPQKNAILNELSKFKTNENYYKTAGLKRKIFYLFLGPIGCGKSSITTAIANYLNYSIKTISIAKIKTNNDFLEAYYSEEESFKNTVFNFDEIDAFNKGQNLIKNALNNTEENMPTKQEMTNFAPTIIINSNDKDKNNSEMFLNKNDDDLNIGIVLNTLDSNEKQDNMVICATCNNVENIDPALYRNGRLKKVVLEYVGKTCIAEMIEKYSKFYVSDDFVNLINDSKTVQSLNVKMLIVDYVLEHPDFDEGNLKELICLINGLYE